MMNRKFLASAFVFAATLLLATPPGVGAQGKPQSGTAAFAFVEVEPGVFGFASGTDQGVPGRFVTLQGDIDGLNFEPGFCHPGVDLSLGFPTSCVVFGEGPGQFTRLRTGGTAFTTCYCTVAGVGEAGDSFVLKISYPPATPPQYPFGFTKFTIQHGTGALAALRGQGTLDFAADPQVSFSYHFAGRSIRRRQVGGNDRPDWSARAPRAARRDERPRRARARGAFFLREPAARPVPPAWSVR